MHRATMKVVGKPHIYYHNGQWVCHKAQSKGYGSVPTVALDECLQEWHYANVRRRDNYRRKRGY